MSSNSPIQGRRKHRRKSRARRSLERTLAGPIAAVAYPGFAEPDPGAGQTRFISASLLVHGTAIAVIAILASLASDLDVAPLHVQLLREEAPPPPPIPEPEPEPPVAIEPEPLPVVEPIPVPPPPIAKPAPPPPPIAKPERPKPPPPPKRGPPPQIDQVMKLPVPVAPPPAARSSPVREVRRAARPAPDLAFEAGPDLSLPAAPGPTRTTRESPSLPTRQARRRPPTAVAHAQPTRLAPPASAAPAVSRQKPVRAVPARKPPKPALRHASTPKPSLRGVSLGSLAPCVTDARERALKQRVVAIGKKRSLCESPNGRFHLLETKNVNAFLMRIERAPGRPAGDRCRELAFALDCLASR